MPNHEYPTEQFIADRQAGRYLCQCDEPVPIRWALYGIVECQQCFRKVVS